MRAGTDLVQGRLDEAAAYLAVAETYARTAPPDRQHRLRVAIASLRLSLARRRGDLAEVVEQVRFLGSPVTGQSDEDIALDSDLRAVALMNLGTAEAWSLALPDAERHLREAPRWPARSTGPTSKSAASPSSHSRRSPLVRDHPAAQPRGDRARRAARLGHRTGDRAGAGNAGQHLVWTGEFAEAERWLQRTVQAVQAAPAGHRLLLHITTGILRVCTGRRRGARGFPRGRTLSRGWEPDALASQVTGWLLATQARLGMTGEARAALGALDDERAGGWRSPMPAR